MLIDAAELPDGSELTGDVCIIGAGAAGITIARELAGAHRNVVLLESGSFDFSNEANDLDAGRSVGRPYMDLTVCRQRFFGGTTNHWGGSCVPLEPIDFERGWPFPRSELEPFYRRAQTILQLGPALYDVADWGIDPSRVPEPFNGPHFVVKMMQTSPPTRFKKVYGPELQQSDQVSVYLNATATQLISGPAGGHLERVEIAAPGGKRYRAKAGAYVLACGGIENARVLLLSGDQAQGGLGNANDLVGRNFMVHLESPGGTILLAEPYSDFSFYTNVVSNGRRYEPFTAWFASFVGLNEATLRRQQLPNARLMWEFGYRQDMQTVRALRRARSWQGSGHRLDDIAAVMNDLGGAGRYVFRRIFMRSAEPVETLSLNFTFEQTPCPQSRIRLGEERDALGQRRVEVDWHIDPTDKTGAQRIVRLLSAEIGRTGFGRLHSLIEDADWPDGMYGDEHHMGTTIMHTNPALGVVNPDCRMHEIDNLWVAGSSVFPRAGFANPTLTIVALALRLASHLRTCLG